MNFDWFSGTCRFLARNVHFSEERRDGEKARNRRIGLWSKEITLVSIRPQNLCFHRFSKIVLFPSAGGTFSKTSQVHSQSLFLKIVLPSVVGTLFLENRKIGRNFRVCVVFWKWCSHQWWERYFRHTREMARHADDAPALCPATFCTKHKKRISELEDPHNSEVLLFHWKYVYCGAMSSK